MVNVKNVGIIKDGPVQSVFVRHLIIELMESVELVIQIPIILMDNVYAIMDSLEILTNVIDVMKVAENALDLMNTTVLLAAMSVILFRKMENVLDRHLVP